jgi:repressor LexA
MRYDLSPRVIARRAGLTDRQREVLGAIEYSLSKRGYPPTVRELANGLGLSSTNGVAQMLDVLERKGVIERDLGVARGLRVVTGG